jgi:hypothetical protein
MDIEDSVTPNISVRGLEPTFTPRWVTSDSSIQAPETMEEHSTPLDYDDPVSHSEYLPAGRQRNEPSFASSNVAQAPARQFPLGIEPVPTAALRGYIMALHAK